MNNSQIAAPTCPYCGSPAELRDAFDLRGCRHVSPTWICANYPTCDSYVGASRSGAPLGTLANRELRRARAAAQAAFGMAWTSLVAARRKTVRDARRAVRKRLARQLGIKADACRIQYLDEAQCWRVVEICRNQMEDKAA